MGLNPRSPTCESVPSVCTVDSGAHWGTVNCTYRGNRQPVRQGAHSGALSPVDSEGTDKQSDRGHMVGHTGAWSTVHTEGTDNKSDRGTLWHCLQYIHRALATRRGWGRVVTEGTYNQTDRGHTQWDTLGYCHLNIQRAQTTSQTGGRQWGTINCTYRGHRQPVRQGADSGALPTVHTEGTDNQSDRSTLGHSQLYIQRALVTRQG